MFLPRLPNLSLASVALVLAISSLCSDLYARGQIEVEAVPGQPFGVAVVTLPPMPEIASAAETNAWSVVERNGRAHYPAFTAGRVRRLLGELLGADLGNGPASLSIAFLFTGDEPLHVTLYVPQPIEVEIVPRQRNGRDFERLRTQWWRDYNAAARAQQNDGDYPPIVQSYLTTMLAARMNLEPPLLSQVQNEKPNEVQQNLQLLLGLESLRLATMKATILGTDDLREPANLPVPRDIVWGPRLEPPFDPRAEIEAMAKHVPEECFYIRFGRFSNYIWLSHLMDDYGGDIGSMITLRGMRANGGDRVEKQLALKQSAIGDLFGDAVISDVALVGRDLFVDEGAALGMLFQARNGLLANSFQGDRKEVLNEEQKNGCTLETVRIADHDVSFLSTPDNRVRSFYAVDGDFHFVTTSRTLVERFYEAGAGKASLANATEFKHARTTMPTNRDDTVFVYFSSSFFRGLISPQYQIELSRRLQSVTDMELLQLARLAGRAERQPAETIEDLAAANLLPRGFGRRPDGSGPIIDGDRMLDSLRGVRGSFTPIPDVPLHGVTRTEAERCARQAAFFESQWKQMDPMLVSVKRFALDPRETNGQERMERLIIDAHVAPLEDSKYGKLTSILGPPTTERIVPVPGDIISIQAMVKGGLLSPNVPPHHLFLGVQDTVPATDLQATGLLKTLRILQTTPGYLGAWPKPGFLDMLPLGLGGGRPDAAGYSQLLFGLWRRQWGGFSTLSFDRRVLDHVAPELRFEPTKDEAQARLHVGDFSKSLLASWVNSLYYERARQASFGNVRFLHALSQQLQVPRDEALTTAERLLDAKLTCTLSGEYALERTPFGTEQWRSTHWPAPGSDGPPATYQAPPLDWFRGLEASLIKYDDRLLLHTQLDMQRKANANEPKIELPFFKNLFNGEKKEQPKPAAESLPVPKAEKIPAKGREF